jgi:hypothetical protein
MKTERNVSTSIHAMAMGYHVKERRRGTGGIRESDQGAYPDDNTGAETSLSELSLFEI